MMTSRPLWIRALVCCIATLLASPSRAQVLNLLWGIDAPKSTPNAYLSIAGLAADSRNNTYITGFAGVYPGLSYFTVKYRSDGSTAWTQRYFGESGSESRASAISVDKTGDVYVTGYSFGDSTYIDYATVSYSPDGQERWVRRYSAPGGSEDMPHDIQVDRDGNILVTGESHSGGNYDFATIKYDSSGNELWVARYDGPAHGDDKAYRVRMDSSGNVYVGGTSPGLGTANDYALVKYSPSGQELWVCRYDDPEHLDDFFGGLDIMPDGTAYVPGPAERTPLHGKTAQHSESFPTVPLTGVELSQYTSTARGSMLPLTLPVRRS